MPMHSPMDVYTFWFVCISLICALVRKKGTPADVGVHRPVRSQGHVKLELHLTGGVRNYNLRCNVNAVISADGRMSSYGLS
jgi:hypothetical protein